MRLLIKTLAACTALALLPASAPAQEVFKEVSAQRLEEILNGLNLEFTKGDVGKGVTFFEFKTKTRKAPVQLLSFDGKDLMIQSELGRADLETLNKHNSAAKFSRARTGKLKNGSEIVLLESNLDLRGGVTEDTIKHFINNFDEELSLWARTSAPVVTEEETFKTVTPQKLEQILKDLKIAFNKAAPEAGVVTYVFVRNKHPIQLSSFGGEDLMIDRHWVGKADLAKVNDWNAKRFFVRAVAYAAMKGKPATVALESNLDCSAGVSESIIRNFINAFDEEVRRFDEYLKK
jgi:hypothetical protein